MTRKRIENDREVNVGLEDIDGTIIHEWREDVTLIFREVDAHRLIVMIQDLPR